MVKIGRAPGFMRLLVIGAVLFLVGGCGQPSVSAAQGADTDPLTLRLGYLPNLTQGPALVGIAKGFFANALGSEVRIEAHPFNAGPDAVTAILSGSIDATFIGPNPTTNAYVQSHGEAVRVVSGTTSGGALLVVRPGIDSVTKLRGMKIADPQLGGSQDIALRWFLKTKGFTSDAAGGGAVSVVPQDNSLVLNAFRQGQIDGAWVPEPWASRLVIEGGARVLVDERDLWPHGRFVTTNLVVNTSFLRLHPQRTKALLEGLYQSIQFLNASPAAAQEAANDALGMVTGKKLGTGVVASAWPHLTFTVDPLAATLKVSAAHAHSLGLLAAVNLDGLYDLTLLNEVLAKHGAPPVAAQ